MFQKNMIENVICQINFILIEIEVAYLFKIFCNKLEIL